MNKLEPGSRVHWTKSSKRGRTISMVRCEGVIVELGEHESLVRLSPHRVMWLKNKRLRVQGERSELTDFVTAVVSANRDR